MPRPGEAHPVADGYVFAAISRGDAWYRGPEGVFTDSYLTEKAAKRKAAAAKPAKAKAKKPAPKEE